MTPPKLSDTTMPKNKQEIDKEKEDAQLLQTILKHIPFPATFRQ